MAAQKTFLAVSIFLTMLLLTVAIVFFMPTDTRFSKQNESSGSGIGQIRQPLLK